jgi:hypothetical protein
MMQGTRLDDYGVFGEPHIFPVSNRHESQDGPDLDDDLTEESDHLGEMTGEYPVEMDEWVSPAMRAACG